MTAEETEAWLELYHVARSMSDVWETDAYYSQMVTIMRDMRRALQHIWAVRPDLVPPLPDEDRLASDHGLYIVYKPDGFWILEAEVPVPLTGPIPTRKMAVTRALEIALARSTVSQPEEGDA